MKNITKFYIFFISRDIFVISSILLFIFLLLKDAWGSFVFVWIDLRFFLIFCLSSAIISLITSKYKNYDSRSQN